MTDLPSAPTAGRVLCVNIDLDDLRFYRGIHALPQEEDRPTIFERAVPRFVEMCGRLGVPSTLFAIADDLRWPEAVEALRQAVAAGHEIASHSRSHLYDLSRRPDAFVDDEVGTSRARLQDATGSAVTGFRGPGYNLSDRLLRALARAGYAYDSSCLGSWSYWAARAAVIGWMRATGRRSSSIPGRASDFLRGRRPFRWPDALGGLVEFPITGTGPARLPLIGTTLADGGAMARHVVRGASGLPFTNVEFHALDFLDIDGDGLDPRLRVEPALRVPLARRLEAFEAALSGLAAGRAARRLDALAVP